MTDTYLIALAGALALLGLACLMIAHAERKESKRDRDAEWVARMDKQPDTAKTPTVKASRET